MKRGEIKGGALDGLLVTFGDTPAGAAYTTCDCANWLARQDAGLTAHCDIHEPMSRAVADLYWHDARLGISQREKQEALHAVLQHADGYGEPGFAPDWSGVRDSSPHAFEQMYAELQKRPIVLGRLEAFRKRVGETEP